MVTSSQFPLNCYSLSLTTQIKTHSLSSKSHPNSTNNKKLKIQFLRSDKNLGMVVASSCPSGSVSWPDNKRKRAIQELVQGRDSAAQLQLLLLQPHCGSSSVSAPRDQLMLNILNSFSHTLSVLASGLDDRSAASELSPVGSACSDDRKSLNSGDFPSKRPDKRGCYKRRKSVQTWTTITPTTEDGQAWRKYGQKNILNAKHPRAYFRCTRKFDQGCRATKQVQLTEDDSQLYTSTYIGVHTCTRDMFKPPQVVTETDPNWDSYNKINDDHPKFQLTNDCQEQGHRLFGLLGSGACRVKEMAEEWDDKDNINVVPTVDSISWPDVLSFDSLEAVSMVYSCADASSRSLDLDFVVNSVGFDNFDENEFL